MLNISVQLTEDVAKHKVIVKGIYFPKSEDGDVDIPEDFYLFEFITPETALTFYMDDYVIDKLVDMLRKLQKDRPGLLDGWEMDFKEEEKK